MSASSYSVYIWLSYGAASVVLIGNIMWTLLKQRRVKRRLKESIDG